MLSLQRILYTELNARQKENYNFQKVSAILADYGFSCLWLNDDWQGADFIANHIDGKVFLKVQLKGRLTFHQKYKNKDIYITFNHQQRWYLYPHDRLMQKLLTLEYMIGTTSWEESGHYSWPIPPEKVITLLKPYML